MDHTSKQNIYKIYFFKWTSHQNETYTKYRHSITNKQHPHTRQCAALPTGPEGCGIRPAGVRSPRPGPVTRHPPPRPAQQWRGVRG